MPTLQVKMIPIDMLIPYENNARTHSKKQVAQISRSLKQFGFNNPILADQSHTIISGHGRLLAAKENGMTEVPVIYLEHMTEAQKKAYILADNKLAEKAGWDKEILKIEFQNLLEYDIDCDLTMTGFETPEIDSIMNFQMDENEGSSLDVLPEEESVPKQASAGDLWQLGSHRLYCGNSLDQKSFDILLGDQKADLIFTDPPYNVSIDGHVCGNGKVKHEEFAFASGEMSEQEFTSFLRKALGFLVSYSKDGSLHYICMDWRHIAEIMSAATAVYTEFKNLCVWNKQLGGMGSLYRSQHELVFIFKNGKGPHINNIELGKHGRNRTNVWDYPGIHISNSHKNDLKWHPTVKNVQMIADAIIDCSKQGAIILDCFAGSGSTLLAAEQSKRRAYVIEFEPKYCDVILFRFEQMTGIKPTLINGGEHV